MSDLDKRKKLLIAEAEVYRETLKLQLSNLQIYGLKTRRKFRLLNPVTNPLLIMGLPLLSSFVFRRRARRGIGWKGISALAVLGWQLYGRFRSTFGRPVRRGVERPTAAEDYLSKSI